MHRRNTVRSSDGNPIQISVFEFSKSDFATLPDADRRLLILGGHALNSLGLWVKLLAASTNARVNDKILDSMNAAQSQMLVRNLCGTLVEVWKWVKSAEVSQLTRETYKNELPDGAAAAYGRLGKHFGPGLFDKARNTFVFHMPDAEQVDKAFHGVPTEIDFNWYLSAENTNSLYFGCEAVVGFGLYDLASKEVKGRSGMERFMSELFAASNDMHEYIGGLLSAVVMRHLKHCPRSQFQVLGTPGPRYAIPFLLYQIFGPYK